ncbi:GH36-type glycosyl hydrolase domain-containing protein [Candidatus Symbiobacter mobilis]|uniref:Cyclic beta-1,2-glucan synthetase n=1 Tax=Candidatus Symbiobacter mobilis CR TaxID=946483 RepID=U5N804_9BURK|nr:glucoamylase family protein [Candidatus Symbiobacter mobilis]AGX87527.1 cyclic beta-1,2-glucan synthetase [Candidatus Symbiobacter mobilis CR]
MGFLSPFSLRSPLSPLTHWDWIPQRVGRILDAGMGPALEPIRSEVFGIQRFAQHGRSLGDTHRAVQARFGQTTFYPRLRDNIRRLRAAHQYLLQQADFGLELSPAAQWLVDNFYLIESQLGDIHDGLPDRYFQSLPVLQDEPLVGLPRVYGVAWAFVAHTDSVFDGDLLVHFLNAYQERRELTQGEMWALPTTFRVVLIENLRRLADRVAAFKAACELANLCSDRFDTLEVSWMQDLLGTLNLRGVGQVFLAQLAQSQQGRRLDPDGADNATLRQWLQQVMPDVQSVQAQHRADQVADNLSVGNAVNALRRIGSVDWSDIVARSSLVMRVMLTSPVFLAEDAGTRDQTLHAIERLAHQAGRGEASVARQLLALMAQAVGNRALARHWLDGPGRPAFEEQLGIPSRTARALRAAWALLRTPAYLLTLLLATAAWVAGLDWHGNLSLVDGSGWPHLAIHILTTAALCLPVSEAVVALLNRLISESVTPVHLPRFSLEQGIPPTERVLVVVPAMLSDDVTTRQLLHNLLLHHLASNERHAQFALLTDWPDAPAACADGDAYSLATALSGIEHLNRTYPVAWGDPPRFLLLHRVRQYSPTQQTWMGWERKRGKLEQLVATLVTGALGPFLNLGESSRLAPGTLHLLTLDSDTQLPPGQLRALVAVAAHPQNQPVLDATGQYVVSGYGILQPRITAPLTDVSADSTLATPYHWLLSGQQGMDPYSAMASDVYQDLFGEGSFTGKGLLNVAVLHAVLGGRLPHERVLSHDLLEGSLVRCAVVSDVTLVESEPGRADVARSRMHRWTRGDWQLLPFLLRPGPWPMAAINRWKMWDNLRRSLVAPASVWMLVMSFLGVGLAPVVALVVVCAAYAAGPLMGAVASLVPVRADFAWRRYCWAAAVDLCRTGLGALWNISQLLQQAVSNVDAIGRTLYRLAVSHRHLMEWATAATLHPDTAGIWRGDTARTLIGPALAASALLASAFTPLQASPYLLCLLWAWLLAPVVSLGVSTPFPRPKSRGPTREQADYLHHVARDTWRLFERLVDASNHHLPPDNLQTSPTDLVAPRTSPTNIGLYLLSVACARSFGWLGTLDMMDRLDATLTTLARLQRYEGHCLNWYNTQTLQPLYPRYVSTVDSGNLCSHLLAVAEACKALAADPFNTAPAAHAVALAQDRLSRVPAQPEATATLPPWWQTDLHDTLVSARRDAQAMAGGEAPATALRLQALAQWLEALAWEASFTFLYHSQRRLLHIGYRVDDQVLDTACYDLLASESRMTSLLAIAKGDVPVAHWAALGRPYFAVGSLAGLRSWSGSMFEYLMPLLVLREPGGSALREACKAAVREHIAYLAHQALPWGISESAYAGRDHTLAYQYAPQGVPRLALRRTPELELVVAPYATALATQVDVNSACANLHALENLGARGRYGFCEATDFTPSRQLHGGHFTLVYAYMAHHQGMSIVALANVVLDGVAQGWGMASPRVQAVQWLLHERAPREIPVLKSPPPRLPVKDLLEKPSRLTQIFAPGAQTVEPTHLMSNGRYSVSLRPNGAGWSRWENIALTRWRDDAPRDTHGSFVYLRLDPARGPMSVTQHPAPDDQATYQSTFHVDRVVFEADWPSLHALTTVWVSPEDDIEFRKVVLVNHGRYTLTLDVLSACEVALCPQAADAAHPAFSNLFVQAQWLPEQHAVLFTRKPRLPTENPFQAAHFIAATEGDVTRLLLQTDRQAWLGRNHAPSGPQAHLAPVPTAACTLVTGLDPVSVLGVSFSIAPGAQAVVTFAMAASDNPTTLWAVIDKHHQASTVERASLMSATLAGIQTRPHHLYPEFLPTFQTLTTALVFTLPRVHLRLATPPGLSPACCDRRLLWSLSISGDRPLLLVTICDLQGMGLLRALVQSLGEWARGGVPCDVVVLSNEVHSYLMPLHRELLALREQHQASLRTPYGVGVTGLHVHRTEELSADQISTLTQRASLCFQADGRSLHHHVRTWADAQAQGRPAIATAKGLWRLAAAAVVYAHRPAVAVAETKGAFDAQGNFRFPASATTRPTRPWINVLANPDFGTQVSEAGGGHTWAINSRLNQLTPWRNDPVADLPGEWLLLQDRRTHAVWSVSPSAWGDPAVTYDITHGQGLTTIRHQRDGLEVTATWCVDAQTAVKHIRLELVNRGDTRQHLRMMAMVEWQMGENLVDRATTVTSIVPPRQMVLGGTMLLCTQGEQSAGLGQGTAFLAMPLEHSPELDGPDWTCDRREFFGPQGRLQLPPQLGRRSGQGHDPCAALARRVTLLPGQRLTQVFLLGYAATPTAAIELAGAAMRVSPEHREQRVVGKWNALLGTCVVSTPDPLFDVLVNRWLLYQTLSSRMWAKAGYYQAGGATGFRDQLQDAMALVWARPDLLHDQIVLAASRQFEAGDVQHWWHMPGGAGVRTHISDDLLWLPYACAHYLRSTGDVALLNTMVPFLTSAPIAEGAEDSYTVPLPSDTQGTVYEHGARAIDHSLQVGAHGLPLMGTGDWNDGMNRVGHGGQGESVWLAWFLCIISAEWIPLARSRQEPERAARWERALAGWQAALDGPAWDGAWYVRAFFDDGSPIGSHANGEARIDLLAQAWAVLSGVAPAARQQQAMGSVETQLIDPTSGLIQLLTPPLAHAQPNAGYIQAYPSGVRENGGQYAHAGVWALMAAARLARHTPAADPARDAPYRYFTYLSPAHRAQDARWGHVYGLEPYAMAGDVYSQPPYVGKGGWSWYTGAAGWLHRAAIESLLGLDWRADSVTLWPCLPSHWNRAQVTLTRSGRVVTLTLLRGDTEEVRKELCIQESLLLPPGQPLVWETLPASSRYVVPLVPT